MNLGKMYASVTQPETKATGCLDDEPPDHLPQIIQNDKEADTEGSLRIKNGGSQSGYFCPRGPARNANQYHHSPPLPLRSIKKIKVTVKRGEIIMRYGKVGKRVAHWVEQADQISFPCWYDCSRIWQARLGYKEPRPWYNAALLLAILIKINET